MYSGKRIFDVLLVLCTMVLWLPVLAIIGILVRVQLGSPVLFRQQRIGWRERPFTILKFRTMTDARDPNGLLLPDEARLPQTGRFLRSTSLDELPELINILRGEMSFVGPRPLLPQYLPLYSEHHRERHAVRPGLTGYAQTSGRNLLSWTQRFDYDVEYVRNASFKMDAHILWKTISIVFRRHGVAAADHATMPAFTGYEIDRTTKDASH